MKLNIIANRNAAMKGYLNVAEIDLKIADYNFFDVTTLTDLDNCCCIGEAEEILFYDILQRYEKKHGANILKHVVSRLAVDGTISIAVVDIKEVSHFYLRDTISLVDVNKAVFGVEGG